MKDEYYAMNNKFLKFLQIFECWMRSDNVWDIVKAEAVAMGGVIFFTVVALIIMSAI